MMLVGTPRDSDTPKRPSTGIRSGHPSPRRRVLSARTRIPGVDYVPFPYVELYQHHGKSSAAQSLTVPDQSMASLLQRLAKAVKDNENKYVPVMESSEGKGGLRKPGRKLSQPQMKQDSELCVKSIPIRGVGSERTSPESKSRKSVTARTDWRLILDRTEKAMESTPHHRKLPLSHLRTAVRNTFSSPKSPKIHQSSATIVLFSGEDISPRAGDWSRRKLEEKERPPAIHLQAKLQKRREIQAEAKAAGIDRSRLASRREGRNSTARTGQKTGKNQPNPVKSNKKDAQSITETLDEEDTWLGFQAKYVN